MERTLTIYSSSGNTATMDWDPYSPSTTDGTQWAWIGGNLPYEPNQAEIHVHTNIQREEVKDMRGLFHIVVVEYKTDKILEDGLVIAKDTETAKIKVLAPFADKYDLDDLDAICNRLGDVRKKKEIQKVEIVESE